MILKFLYIQYLRALALPLIMGLYLFGWKKSVLAENLRICGIANSRRFRFRFYRALVRDFLEFAHGRYSGTLSPRPRDAIRFERLKSSPSLYLTAHFHSWEMMGSWMTKQGIPLLSGARPMTNPRSQSWLILFRRRLGMHILFRSIPRGALKHLESGKCFAFLWDQRVATSETSAILFGRKVLMDPLPPFLIRHVSAPTYFGVLLPNGQVRLVQLSSGSGLGSESGSPKASPPQSALEDCKLSRRYHRVLEFLVSRHPEYWYGLAHRRFLATDSYESTAHVSRETSTPSGLIVSRETKLSYLK